MGKTRSSILLDLCYMNCYMASGHTCGVLSSCSLLKIIHPNYAFPNLKSLSKGKQKVYPSVRECWVQMHYSVLLLSTHNY